MNSLQVETSLATHPSQRIASNLPVVAILTFTCEARDAGNEM